MKVIVLHEQDKPQAEATSYIEGLKQRDVLAGKFRVFETMGSGRYIVVFGNDLHALAVVNRLILDEVNVGAVYHADENPEGLDAAVQRVLLETPGAYTDPEAQRIHAATVALAVDDLLTSLSSH